MDSAQPYTEALRMEAALCIWEAMNDTRYGNPRAKPVVRPWMIEMDLTWKVRGTVEMRHTAIDLADKALEVFDLIGRHEGAEALDLLPYDWEFIPAFVAHVDWTDCTADATRIAESLAERRKSDA